MDHASNHRTSTSTGGETDCTSEKGLSLCQVVCWLSSSVLGASLTHMGTQTYLLTKSMQLADQAVNDANRCLGINNVDLVEIRSFCLSICEKADMANITAHELPILLHDIRCRTCFEHVWQV